MKRQVFTINGLKLSYLDTGGAGLPLLALHSHWMEGQTYVPLAEALTPQWRVVALDQRGHGYSDHANSYTGGDYLADITGLLDRLDIKDTVILGNSLGGANAYQFAARYPERVRALIIEDIGAIIDDDSHFVLQWSGFYPTRDELAQRIGSRLLPYLTNSFRETAQGWTLAFDPNDMLQSQLNLNGDHWDDWLASSCPALLLRGRDSPITTQQMMQAMADKRPNTQFATLAGGHVLHVDNSQEFIAVVKKFLQSLPQHD